MNLNRFDVKCSLCQGRFCSMCQGLAHFPALCHEAGNLDDDAVARSGALLEVLRNVRGLRARSQSEMEMIKEMEEILSILVSLDVATCSTPWLHNAVNVEYFRLKFLVQNMLHFFPADNGHTVASPVPMVNLRVEVCNAMVKLFSRLILFRSDGNYDITVLVSPSDGPVEVFEPTPPIGNVDVYVKELCSQLFVWLDRAQRLA